MEVVVLIDAITLTARELYAEAALHVFIFCLTTVLMLSVVLSLWPQRHTANNMKWKFAGDE